MDLYFDLTDDELAIYLAESEEHLQVLDHGLVELENKEVTSNLVEELFRAAHTLKGSAGMIGHKRMVLITHVLETALDGVRKQSLTVDTQLIDMCLEAVDAIRLLRDEVVNQEESSVDAETLAERFEQVVASLAQNAASDNSKTKQPKSKKKKPSKAKPAAKSSKPAKKTGKSTKKSPAKAKKATKSTDQAVIAIQADIAPDSIASAARAFQIMISLQELGEIVSMDPDQAHIERADPVSRFNVQLSTSQPKEKVHQALLAISEVEKLVVDGEQIGESSPATEARSAPLKQASTAQKKSAPKKGDKTIRTSVERLDNLMNLVGELITDRNRLNQIYRDLEVQLDGQRHIEELAETIAHVDRIADQLQYEVLGIRMVPIASVFNKYPRLVRDLARKANKKIELIIEGEETEVDRSVIEVISDPIIHLLRNSVDHGVEASEDRVAIGKPALGKIMLTACQDKGQIVITVEDDGQGIDPEKVKKSAVKKGVITEEDASSMSDDEAIDLIFRSGFSTSAKVSEISGRGVGMDIVRTNIESLNGNILVDTKAGLGTRFQIMLPLTLAVIPTLLVGIDTGTYAIPLTAVNQTLRIPESEVHSLQGSPAILLRDQVLQLAYLDKTLGFTRSASKNGYLHIVAVRTGKTQVGIVVNNFIREEEVMIKSLGMLDKNSKGVSGATILGDGSVALVIDTTGLFRLLGLY